MVIREELIGMDMNKRYAQQHLMLTRALTSLVQRMEHKQIDYRILKGIPLNQLLYGNKLVRRSCDIDVLIHFEDLKPMHQALSEQGYELQQPETFFNLVCERGFLSRYMDQLSWRHPETKILIDVQWHTAAMNYKGFILKDLQGDHEIAIYHQKIKVLTPEQNFHYLCIHGAKHFWERAQWLNDLAVFSQSIAYQWHEVLSLATKTKSIRALLEAKYLLKKIHNIELNAVPHSLRDRLTVKFRLFFIRQHKQHKYVNLFFILFLLPELAQKKHYLIRVLLFRLKALKQMDVLENPTPWKMILRSFI